MEIIYRSSGLRIDTLMSNVKNVNVCSNHVIRDDHHNLDEVSSSGLVEYLLWVIRLKMYVRGN